jgi:hypothetical protein
MRWYVVKGRRNETWGVTTEECPDFGKALYRAIRYCRGAGRFARAEIFRGGRMSPHTTVEHLASGVKFR